MSICSDMMKYAGPKTVLAVVCWPGFVFWLCLNWPLQTLAQTTQPDVEKVRQQLSSRAGFVAKLLNESSAATRVLESDSTAAHALHKRAREQYQKALDALNEGDPQLAESKLRQASETMFAAVAKAGKPDNSLSKQRRDYVNRLEAIDALLSAHERVSKEYGKKGGTEHKDLVRKVEQVLARADQLGQNEKYDTAMVELIRVYQEIKLAIDSKRSGQTLVRSLEFKSDEEEYLYELDRNDTHRMLITVLVAEKMQKRGVEETMSEYEERAAELRKQAERMAAKGEHRQAIEQLEAST